ncbi:MAG: p-hydroxycinnamoyl CoA hydratase/lyase [Variovorax sp.]|nr:MAG: p-hydroxycinnamoyl CoA hydratase/lyase [Variovorax sp.]
MQYHGPDNSLGAMRCVKADQDEGILTIALNRPDRHNAMNVALTLEMEKLLQVVGYDQAVRAVVVRGDGSGFCAGMDMQDFHDTTRRDEMTLHAARDAADNWRVRLLRLLPQPVIAMVHGFCEGAAIGIVEGCDIAFAADDTQFALSEVESGHLPAGPVGKSISRVMTPRAASYFSLSGKAFDGKEAERNGLVTRSFPAAELEKETYALAKEFVGKDPIALQFTKETLQHVGPMSWDGVLNFSAAKFAELKSLQAGRPSSRSAAVESFLAGKSKPGLGG